MNIKAFFKGFRNGMKEFGEKIGIIVNSILLLIVYILGVGITSLIAKISKKRFFERNLAKRKTYWEDLNLKNKKIDSYYKQF